MCRIYRDQQLATINKSVTEYILSPGYASTGFDIDGANGLLLEWRGDLLFINPFNVDCAKNLDQLRGRGSFMVQWKWKRKPWVDVALFNWLLPRMGADLTICCCDPTDWSGVVKSNKMHTSRHTVK